MKGTKICDEQRPRKGSSTRPRTKRRNDDESKRSSGGKRRRRVRRGNHKDVQALADAIRTCVRSLIDDVMFNELEDRAIENGCLTEDDCRQIGKIEDRKKQVRTLVILMTKRSFVTMSNFLDTVNTTYPYIARNIWKEYDRNVKEHPKCPRFERQCPLCSLKNAVDVEKVIDDLFSVKIIDESLYAEINSSRKEVGQQDNLWNAVLKACIKQKGIERLLDSLEANDHFTHITNRLRKLFKNNTGMMHFCTCTLDKRLAKIRTLSLDSVASHTPHETSDSNSSSDGDIKSEPEAETEVYSKENDSGKMQIELSESDIMYDPLINCRTLRNKDRTETNEQSAVTGLINKCLQTTNKQLSTIAENVSERNIYEHPFPVFPRHRDTEKRQQSKKPGRFKSIVSSALVQLRVLRRFTQKDNRKDLSRNYKVDISEMVCETEL